MGNSFGRSKRKTTKIMKINGETTKLKTPIQAMEVTNKHPGHVLLDSEAVKHYGVRAKPLDPTQFLEPKRLYFLVELPKFPQDHHKVPRRVRSGEIHMSAKDRLESLMLSRRSVSDLSLMKPAGSVVVEEAAEEGPMRVRMRLPRAEVERLMRQSKDEAEAAERIMNLCRGKSGSGQAGDTGFKGKEVAFGLSVHQQQVRRERSPLGARKRVGFLPVNEEEIQLALASR